ncbi:Hsp20/alpha crystallin family protein [Desulfobacter latus]|uniref:Hsp20/alpha crystallin family protein n=1 Tax=Desulfobacter latus TaxID=2292 RepID=A0A850SSE6_9BACT|nr:Hsp20/alpha crystallin family protein [Desulfobacter latus]NWH04069.1 Hsp20/alpha crystallin family protein [Desulfobacter latus]
MEQIKIRFGNDIETPATEEKSFEDMFQSVNPMFCFSKRIWRPQMDIFETRDEIIIQAEIAGVCRENMMIEISDKAVKISGVRNSSQPDPTATYRLAEIQFGRFERVLYLPNIIDMEKVSASYANGFLELKLGKQPKTNYASEQKMPIDFL